MHFKVKKFKELSVDELYDLLRLREQIFVVEQSCIYVDADGVDKKSIHVLGLVKNKIVAYARVIPEGVTYSTPSIGRVVVAEKHRGKKYAYDLMDVAIEVARKKLDAKKITISAQVYLKEFYKSIGFKPIGKPYLEDGLPHVKMICKV
ncbi:MAG TPA: GNAT family N-acetyltransferase [Bacteroidia bacterium]|nr:GNAT family N-acetyltransferase [Bacteroidia bacterium]